MTRQQIPSKSEVQCSLPPYVESYVQSVIKAINKKLPETRTSGSKTIRVWDNEILENPSKQEIALAVEELKKIYSEKGWRLTFSPSSNLCNYGCFTVE